MNIENSNLYGALEPAKLEAFEAKIGSRLPDEYRAFLLEHNGGLPDKRAFMAPDDPLDEDSEWSERELVGFYGLHEQNVPIREETMGAFKLSDAWRDLQTDVPGNTLLPISQDTGGSYVCIDISRNNFGEVCFFDHEYEVVVPLADSFQSFLELLTENSGGEE
jgi:cell wall assembly regulator SMI1